MGRIFGISDLPASTIMTPFERIKIENPAVQKPKTKPKAKINQLAENTVARKPKFIDLKNGFGKLMKHFSKVK